MGVNFKVLALSALATISHASPLLYPRATDSNVTYVFTNPNGLNFTQMNTTLPNVTIFATGGTIAGSSADNTATTGYKAGAVGIQTLIDAVPEMLNVANVAGVQVTNVGSPDITSDILLRLSKQINEVVCNDPTMAGAVVTHGTDTLEESAFFLDATVNCRKPVVIVGAMRPSTAISADGPLNLLQSVTVATSPKARDRGALIVMNDRIVSAFYASKTNANTVDTFKAIEMGNLGEVVSNKPYFFYPPVKPTGKTEVDIRNITSIPRVDILYSYEDMQNDTLYSAIDNGAKGIVIAGSGSGSVSTPFSAAMEDITTKHNIPIVASTRTGNGEVPSSAESSQIASGYLNPAKSRVLLGLLLAQGKSIEEMRAVFERIGVA
ncbi:Asparaginase/glutaminase [Aspergillus flavus]|uniref:asparaginase n=2 Tax=Aspergillus subgen. Circumdati TaxID=2720871 RepID=A0A5N6GMA8_ASPFL|nr:asparaginase [Aspergillus oryzae 3.042]KAB8242230.1 Asparaginase/glutaminase [Aspergillus flavus]KDE81546.1 asparaginase [Aspergillus oryzae 100-8]|eukprot:EIT80150.1 asparaginase [Aspergillus oryzae 3.042]